MTRLIISADDYGRSPDISRGIRESHLHGVVTSTSCMMNILTTADDIQTALQESPQLDMGVHLVLTMGKPLSEPESVPSLVNENGFFFKLRPLLDRLPSLDVEEVKKEWRAQIERFIQASGHRPTHLDSHHHISYFTPELFGAMLEFAEEYQCAIRYPFSEAWMEKEKISKNVLVVMQEFSLRRPDTFISDFYDQTATLVHLQEIVNNIKDGANELMCHPGYVDQVFAERESPYNFQRERELTILVNPVLKETILSNGIELITFANL